MSDAGQGCVYTIVIGLVLLVVVAGLPLMRLFLRDGVGRLLLARRRARGRYYNHKGEEVS